MSNDKSNIRNIAEGLSLPSGAHGVLSTSLTDSSPDYVWFDCEAEF